MAWDITAGNIGGTLSGWAGTYCTKPVPVQPRQLLELYDIELSPYCRLVRQVMTELDLDALIYPCPAGGARYRPGAVELGGKALFPFLCDPNSGAKLYESVAIIEYLSETYQRPITGTRGVRRGLKLAGSYILSALRHGHGSESVPSTKPGQPLELFSFESCPYSRRVREVLCELELPYVLRNTGKAAWIDLVAKFDESLSTVQRESGRNRKVLFERTQRVRVPYLIDSNTGAEMYESRAIVHYLQTTYAIRR